MAHEIVTCDASEFHAGKMEVGGPDVFVAGLDPDGLGFVEEEIAYSLGCTVLPKVGIRDVLEGYGFGTKAGVNAHLARTLRWARLAGSARLTVVENQIEVAWHGSFSRTGYENIATTATQALYAPEEDAPARMSRTTTPVKIIPTDAYDRLIANTRNKDAAIADSRQPVEQRRSVDRPGEKE